MKREFSAGGVVFKKEKGKLLWLVRRASGGENYRGNLGWTLPKGWIDDRDEGKKPGLKASGEERATQEDLQSAALREVEEEGGIRAKIISKLDTVRVYFTDQSNEKVMKFITYFLMEFEEDLPGGFGWETAEVKWCEYEEVVEMLAYKSEKELVKKAKEKIGND
jgi:8-oxo-dGTP pyrophosphatase MutT (NUDIX family)